MAYESIKRWNHAAKSRAISIGIIFGWCLAPSKYGIGLILESGKNVEIFPLPEAITIEDLLEVTGINRNNFDEAYGSIEQLYLAAFNYYCFYSG